MKMILLDLWSRSTAMRQFQYKSDCLETRNKHSLTTALRFSDRTSTNSWLFMCSLKMIGFSAGLQQNLKLESVPDSDDVPAVFWSSTWRLSPTEKCLHTPDIVVPPKHVNVTPNWSETLGVRTLLWSVKVPYQHSFKSFLNSYVIWNSTTVDTNPSNLSYAYFSIFADKTNVLFCVAQKWGHSSVINFRDIKNILQTKMTYKQRPVIYEMIHQILISNHWSMS